MRIENLQEQKEMLEKYLPEINTVVSAKIGFKTNFDVVECKDYAKRIFYMLQDKRNVKDKCGIMSSAFTEVTMEGRIYWNEDNTTISLHFEYDHITGGSNGCEFCCIYIDYENEIVRLCR